MTDIVELDEHRPHISGPVVCTRCRHKWTAVRPVGTDLLECPVCGASRGASFGTMLHKPHLILGAECCGQRDGDGVCASPACLYGDALKLVQCIRDASHLEYTALRAENERLRAALEEIASGKYSGIVLTSYPPQDPAVNLARAALKEQR